MQLLRRLLVLAALGSLAVTPLSSCDDGETVAPAPLAATCELTADPARLEPVLASEVAVHLDAPEGLGGDRVRADLGSYLGRVWGSPVDVRTGKPDLAAPHAIWISASAEARAIAGEIPVDGYVIRRLDQAGSDLVLVAADTPEAIAAATYALLEELGVRFFHPKDELVPELGGAFLPRAVDVARRPAFARRGVQLHLLHPTEYFRPFLEPGERNLADAKQLIDWLVKTGHDQLQWWMLGSIDLEAYQPHGQAIIDYAHARGVEVGVIVQLFSGSSLQDAYDLVTDEAAWETQIPSRLDAILTLDWDIVDMGLGEFLAGDPDAVVAWLNHATSHIEDNHPGVELSVVNHIGNDESLYVEYQGETVFFYHLPGLADPRLTSNVHTVFFFDLYRGWACYGHEDFVLQREYLLEQLPIRKVRYMPESAYWASADIDVPVFLPAYIEARWNDIHGLTEEIAAAGLPALDGHVMFSSGHEWGYWLTDYLAAKMQWEPERDLRHFIDQGVGAIGTCGPTLAQGVADLMAIQRRYLFDQRLAGYLSGEDLHDDIGALAGFHSTPRRISFEEVHAMSESDQAGFESEVIAGLDGLAAETAAVEASLAAACARPVAGVASFCGELVDGAAIVRLRATHTATLFRAVLGSARADGSAVPRLDEARALTEQAAAVIARREAGYRWNLTEVAEPWVNPTIYDFGYLKQAHTQCFWRRRDEQARFLVEEGVTGPVAALPSCVD